MELSPELARRVALVVLDADGVLTDGGIYVVEGRDGAVRGLRRFHVRDGLGIYLLRRAGIALAVVSGTESVPVRARARELGIGEVHQVPAFQKLRTVEGILERSGLGWEQVACLADDLADLAVLERVGLPAAVGDAVPEVREAAAWVGRAPGGAGAVREFAEALLRARGEWEGNLRAYLEASRRGTDPASQGGAGG